jgi:uncharacterized protein YdeI (YjbR/CyaY-like superfamily)
MRDVNVRGARGRIADLELTFLDARAFDRWLEQHHATSTGVWLKLAKKGAAVPSVSYAEAVDVALRWGWIDGQKRAYDACFWLQRFCPRGKKSLWSKINREKATRLIAAGRMQPAGLAEVERAKADGRWDAAYDSPSGSTMPEDFAGALTKNARAATFFASIDAANRYAMLWRVQTAKKAETRARHFETFVAMLARGELLHPAHAKTPRTPATRR